MKQLLKLFRKGKRFEYNLDNGEKEVLYIKNLTRLDELEKEEKLDEIRSNAEKHFDKVIGDSYKKTFIASDVEDIARMYVNNTYIETFMQEVARQLIYSGEDDAEKINAVVLEKVTKETASKDYQKKIDKQVKDLSEKGKDYVLDLLIKTLREKVSDEKAKIWRKAILVYYAVFEDENYTKRYFESPEQVMNTDAQVIDTLYKEYEDLILSKDELKKNTAEQYIQGDDVSGKTVQSASVGRTNTKSNK